MSTNAQPDEPILIFDSNRGIHIYPAIIQFAQERGYACEPYGEDEATEVADEAIEWLNNGETEFPGFQFAGQFEENAEGFYYMPKFPVSLAQVLELVPLSTYLVDVDYRMSLDQKTLCECWEAGSMEPAYHSLDEWESDNRFEGTNWLVSEVRSGLYDIIDELEDIEDVTRITNDIMSYYDTEIRVLIEERDQSEPWKQILSNSGMINVRVTMFSNYDCFCSHWLESQYGYSYKSSYFGDMVNVLYLNPRKVKELLLENGQKVVGEWPNLKYREGKEFVSYSDFWTEIENNSCPSNLCFLAQIGPKHIGSEPVSYTIPKGNTAGIFSSFQGGGSLLEMTLLRPLTFKPSTKYPYLEIRTDEGNGYSVKEVFGCDNSIFDGDLIFTPKNTKR